MDKTKTNRPSFSIVEIIMKLLLDSFLSCFRWYRRLYKGTWVKRRFNHSTEWFLYEGSNPEDFEKYEVYE